MAGFFIEDNPCHRQGKYCSPRIPVWQTKKGTPSLVGD